MKVTAVAFNRESIPDVKAIWHQSLRPADMDNVQERIVRMMESIERAARLRNPAEKFRAPSPVLHSKFFDISKFMKPATMAAALKENIVVPFPVAAKKPAISLRAGFSGMRPIPAVVQKVVLYPTSVPSPAAPAFAKVRSRITFSEAKKMHPRFALRY